MRGFIIGVIVLLNFLCSVFCNINNVLSPPTPCFKAYDKAGASSLLDSPDCHQWLLASHILPTTNQNCEFATIQGHRDYQEDRVACNLSIKLPFLLGEEGTDEVTLSVASIFDGHGGSEVSELASMKVLEYFQVNAVFNAYRRGFHLNQKSEETDRQNSDHW